MTIKQKNESNRRGIVDNSLSCDHVGCHGAYNLGAGDLICRKSLPKPKELVAKWWPSKNFNLKGWLKKIIMIENQEEDNIFLLLFYFTNAHQATTSKLYSLDTFV